MTQKPSPPTFREAQDGIYIDFEGPQNDTSALLGCIIDGCLERAVLDDGLRLAAQFSGFRLSTLDDEFIRILKLGITENRKIFAFSHTERTIFKNYSSLSDRLSEFEDLYVDVRKLSKDWITAYFPEIDQFSYSLKNLSDFLGFPYPPNIGKQKASKRIRDVKNMLVGKSSFDELTPVAKGKWTKLLKYNRLDCENLYWLTKRIALDYSYKSLT